VRSARSRAIVLGALCILAACSRGATSAGAPGGGDGSATGGARTPAEVAIQIADLPAGFQECEYSGDIEAYLADLREVDPDTHASLRDTWIKFRAAGASAAYAAFYGDSRRACDNFLLPVEQRNFGTEAEHVADHPKMATSFVFQFEDEASAEAAYRSDYFGQSKLTDEIAMDVAVGEATRLSANAISAATQGSPIQLRQAAWQRGPWNVSFRSTALDRQASENVTAAVNLRMGAGSA